MMYMHNTVSLEEELKKANAARAQLETYKRQVRKYLNFLIIKIERPQLYFIWCFRSGIEVKKKKRHCLSHSS